MVTIDTLQELTNILSDGTVIDRRPADTCSPKIGALTVCGSPVCLTVCRCEYVFITVCLSSVSMEWGRGG